jgi:hypothetical protein
VIASTVSTVELAWLIGGAAALLLNVLALRDVVDDRRVLRAEQRNGLLRIAANGGVYREAQRVAAQVLLLLVGMIAAATPDPPQGTSSDDVRRWAILAVLLAFQWLLVVSALYDRVVRRRMVEYDAASAGQNA